MIDILGIILIIFLAVFAYCSCVVASWADREMEDDLEKRKKDEKENI